MPLSLMAMHSVMNLLYFFYRSAVFNDMDNVNLTSVNLTYSRPK